MTESKSYGPTVIDILLYKKFLLEPFCNIFKMHRDVAYHDPAGSAHEKCPAHA